MNHGPSPQRFALTAFVAVAALQGLAVAEENQQLAVPLGFDARLFAREPMIINPVAMTWDARGRLWVVERHELSLSRKTGKDRIKILEDTNADGKADKALVFANGFHGATGILLGHGVVYLAEGADLRLLEDTNGDDKPENQRVLWTGLGERDRQILLNSLLWGPDGNLYLSYNVFSRSARDTQPAFIAAGAGRIDPRTGRFERFAEGLGNSWGLDFDSTGNAFIATAGHLSHILPGGIYERPGSSPLARPPRTIDELQGNYAGINVYHGDQWPHEWQAVVLHGKPGANAIQTGRFIPNGSTFDFTNSNANSQFLVANDTRFSPVSIQTGPDGAVWIADCRDKWFRQQGRDRQSPKQGRIWRMVWTGDNLQRPVSSRPSQAMDLSKLSSADLAALLAHPNIWHRRMAQRLLSERGLTAFGRPHLHQGTPLHKLMEKDTNTHVRLAALWTAHGAGFLEEVALDTVASDKDPALRRWAARLTGERGYLLKDSFDRLIKLAKDSDLSVRTAAAIAARQFVSSDLTTNTPPKIPITEVATGGILSALFLNSSNNVDETFDFHFWMALEPIVAFDPGVIDY
ncbi:MAG: dehydrogenase, partial [Verrucomicrobia subdivision 3 bacterium]|nr:dehydrogenase [Limisphaerales bacterium]